MRAVKSPSRNATMADRSCRENWSSNSELGGGGRVACPSATETFFIIDSPWPAHPGLVGGGHPRAVPTYLMEAFGQVAVRLGQSVPMLGASLPTSSQAGDGASSRSG